MSKPDPKEKIIKPSILSGFMELLPEDQLSFNKMEDSIRESFELCGFLPLDTPVIEKAEILTAKGGKETEKQTYVFKKGSNDLALRFDLTVPFARYVSQHINEISFPFKRYQIGKVFRGERPQKGRFREFYQCDIDIVEKDYLDPIYDAEIVSAAYTTIKNLNIGDFTVKINNRKLLSGLIEDLGLKTKTQDILREVDKIKKTSRESVKTQIESACKGFDNFEDKTRKIMDFVETTGSNSEVLEQLEKTEVQNEIFALGVKELKELVENIKMMGIPEDNFEIDLSVVRGLDYYTGNVFETLLKDHVELGSICGGGRYENLAGYYTTQKLPGVGVSIGLTRLFDQLKKAGVVKSASLGASKVFIMPLGGYVEAAYCLASGLRSNNIPADVLIAGDTLKKKLSIASKLGAGYAAIIGEDEVKNKVITFKNMETGAQEKVYLDKAVDFIKLGK